VDPPPSVYRWIRSVRAQNSRSSLAIGSAVCRSLAGSTRLRAPVFAGLLRQRPSGCSVRRTTSTSATGAGVAGGGPDPRAGLSATALSLRKPHRRVITAFTSPSIQTGARRAFGGEANQNTRMGRTDAGRQASRLMAASTAHRHVEGPSRSPLPHAQLQRALAALQTWHAGSVLHVGKRRGVAGFAFPDRAVLSRPWGPAGGDRGSCRQVGGRPPSNQRAKGGIAPDRAPSGRARTVQQLTAPGVPRRRQGSASNLGRPGPRTPPGWRCGRGGQGSGGWKTRASCSSRFDRSPRFHRLVPNGWRHSKPDPGARELKEWRHASAQAALPVRPRDGARLRHRNHCTAGPASEAGLPFGCS